MNIFKKISLLNKITKVVKAIKKIIEKVSQKGADARKLVDDFLNLAEQVKALCPDVKAEITEIIDIIKNV